MLRNDTATGAWVDVGKYANPQSVLQNEVGMYAGIRWLRSGNATITTDGGAGTVDIYNTNVVGFNALGRADTIPPKLVITGPFDVLGRFLNIGLRDTSPTEMEVSVSSAELSGKATVKYDYVNPNRRPKGQGQSIGDEIIPPRGRTFQNGRKDMPILRGNAESGDKKPHITNGYWYGVYDTIDASNQVLGVSASSVGTNT